MSVAIIGAGPAGLSAAVYAASEGLPVTVYEGATTPIYAAGGGTMQVGGQAATSSRIENFLGFPQGLSGADLATRAHQQAMRLGATFTNRDVVGIALNGERRILLLTDGTYDAADVVILAVGVQYRHLDAFMPDADNIHYGAATHLAPDYTGKDVVIVGGANSAGQAALHLSRYANTVTMLVRGDGIERTMSDYLVKRIHDNPDIHVRINTEITAAGVDGHGLVDNLTTTTGHVPTDGVFVFIGATPRSDAFAVDKDERGFITTDHMLQTSIPGIFAVGDVRAGSTKRVATAIGEGAQVISHVHTYLDTV